MLASLSNYLLPFRNKIGQLNFNYFRNLHSNFIPHSNCFPFLPQTVNLGSCSNLKYRSICTTGALMKKARVSMTFIRHDGARITATGKEGDSVLDVVVNNELDLQGFGVCEGTLSCSTCHIVFKPEDYKKLSDEPTFEEEDMLSLALDLSETSRLGCQVTLTKDMEGMEVKVPAVVRDAREYPGGIDTAKR